jgi:hypothetical protein
MLEVYKMIDNMAFEAIKSMIEAFKEQKLLKVNVPKINFFECVIII